MTDSRLAEANHLSWLGITRLGLVQTALGAIFVLSTSTLNRVMKIELGSPASLPGLLIALQYFIQVLRPRLGHGSDVGGRRTPLIIGGMAVLAAGGLFAAVATATMTTQLWLGLALAVMAFVVIGIGVSAAGTSLLVLLATRTAPARRPAAAAIAWVMMIMGFIVTAGVAGKLLDPFSPTRLVFVAAVIAGVGFFVTIAAVWGVEKPAAAGHLPQQHAWCLRASAARGLGRAQGAAVRPLRLRLDARLWRRGTDDRAFRRLTLRHDARRDGQTVRRAARRLTRRHGAGRGDRHRTLSNAGRHPTPMDGRRLPRLGRGAGRPSRLRRCRVVRRAAPAPVRPRSRQRSLCHCRDRLDDAADRRLGRYGVARFARRCAHGPVGRGAGSGLRLRRSRCHDPQRRRARGRRQACRDIRRRVRDAGRHLFLAAWMAARLDTAAAPALRAPLRARTVAGG